jgi:hypothetical protein
LCRRNWHVRRTDRVREVDDVTQQASPSYNTDNAGEARKSTARGGSALRLTSIPADCAMLA